MSDNLTNPMPADLFNQILSELKNINTRLDALEAKQYDTRPIWQGVLERLEKIEVRLEKIEVELTEFKKQTHADLRDIKKLMANHQIEIANLDERVEALEDRESNKN